MSLKDAIRVAAQEQKRQESQQTVLPENQNTSELVNLTIKVHKRQRRHWLIEAKKQDTSLTAAIVEALNARFGPPDIS